MARHHCSIKKGTLDLQVFEKSISVSLVLWIKLVGSIVNSDQNSVQYNTPGHFLLQSVRTWFPWFNVPCLSCRTVFSRHLSPFIAVQDVLLHARSVPSRQRFKHQQQQNERCVCVCMCMCVPGDCRPFFSLLSSISLWKGLLGGVRPWEKAFGLSGGQRQKDSWCWWSHTWYPPQRVINSASPVDLHPRVKCDNISIRVWAFQSPPHPWGGAQNTSWCSSYGGKEEK